MNTINELVRIVGKRDFVKVLLWVVAVTAYLAAVYAILTHI